MTRKEYLKNYRQIHRTNMKKYRREHEIRIKWLKKLWYKNNKKKHLLRMRRWYLKNRDKLLQKAKEYRLTHKKEICKYLYNRRNNDINFKILGNLRHRLHDVLKGNPKLSTTMSLVGCSIQELKQHLENKFTSGMSWNNYGKWHIDHIKQCFKFDLSKVLEQKKCFNYKNLRPLWAVDNLSRPKKENR
jgi:hypothetical protein